MTTSHAGEQRFAEQTGETCLAGGGEMGGLMRSIDWSRTPIGPVESWSPALRMMVRLLLANRFPLLLWWGPHYIQLYNDAYRPIPGTKHPESMGQPASECWPEIWPIIGPLIDTPFHGGPATWMEDIFLEPNRYGFVEETHFTIAYSPVPDETAPHGIGGVLGTVHEITEKVVGERRVRALRDLGARATGAKTPEEACAVAADILAAYDKDVPFALLYLLDSDGTQARLAGAAGVPAGAAIGPLVVDLNQAEGKGWPLAEARRTGAMQVVQRLDSHFAVVPPGPWSDPPHTAVVVPIASNRAREPAGFLVAGISARLSYDDSYRGFFELLTTQVATAVSTARAYEEERQRAEGLAELDRAKTTFFSNVSHEFRTPLTLMLGPIEDELADVAEPERRERLKVAHRNSLRLLKLVNTLLEFSRIEAGRVQAVYEPTDLSTLTAELASVFRSACERAGLALVVDCPPLPERVYVDREMWEKIVLNLLSNAFKFTWEGEIAVALRPRSEGKRRGVELTVRDTGTGVPDAELPRLFERFHRVEGARGRTHEGTGIGLALVQELVKLHGGTIDVASQWSQGTTFTVRLRMGKAHLPSDRIGAPRTLASTAMQAGAYAEEALRWLTGEGTPGEALAGLDLLPDGAETRVAPAAGATGEPRPRILLADDNADMRAYLSRLLAGRYAVEAVADGEAALAAAVRQPPDLVLTDIMMPGLDGFGLLKRLRAEPRLRTTPILMLSARAGEEARIDGLEAGADDYLTKPFSARELLARVGAHLELARLRQEAAHREHALRAAAESATARLEAVLASINDQFFTLDPDWRYTYVNARVVEAARLPAAALLGQSLWELFPDMVGTPFEQELRRAMAEQTPVQFEHFYPRWGCWLENRVYPSPEGMSLLVTDITARKQAEEALRESNQRFRQLADAMPQIVWAARPDGYLDYYNERWYEYTGFPRGEYGQQSWEPILHPDDVQRCVETYFGCIKAGQPYQIEYRFKERRTGGYRWFLGRAMPVRDEQGRILRWFGTCTDIDDAKRAEEALREADRRKDEFLAMLAHELRNPLAPIRNAVRVLQKQGSLEPPAVRSREIIERQVQIMARLLDDLLDASRITRGMVRLEKEPLDLTRVVGAAVEATRPFCEARDHRLSVSLPEESLVVKADRVRLEQVVVNLLNNAIKYTDPGGKIAVRVWRGGRDAVFQVADTGRGIAPELLPHLFELFRQGERNLDRSQGGLGIGLTMVKRLVDLHGGSVTASSAGPGQGSQFTVRLPLIHSGLGILDAGLPVKSEAPEVVPTGPIQGSDSPALAPAGPIHHPESPIQDLKRVLVVDDNADSAESLADLVNLWGYETQIATNGPSALEATESYRPAAVLLDIGMPGLDGYEVARQLRHQPELAHIRLVAMTGYGREEDRERAREAGFDYHLTKPVNPDELKQLLAALFSNEPGKKETRKRLS